GKAARGSETRQVMLGASAAWRCGERARGNGAGAVLRAWDCLRPVRRGADAASAATDCIMSMGKEEEDIRNVAERQRRADADGMRKTLAVLDAALTRT